MAKKLKWMEKNIQNYTSVTEIFLSNLELGQVDLTELIDYEQIASYSWSSKSSSQEPIIYVPGRPKVLKSDLNSIISNKLSQNTCSKSVIDMNRLYLPNYPMEPIFRSISYCSPDFDYSKVDFITDRNNLRKLFELVERSHNVSFMIDLQKIGNFIMMIRREQSSKAISFGFGEDFESKTTVGHGDYNGHRIISSYGFGNHKILVRFELDCIDDNNCNEIFQQDEIERVAIDKSSKLSCIQDGIFRPKALVEITSKAKPGLPKKKWAQMFFSGTNNLVIGFHKDGVLNRIEKVDFKKITSRLDSRKNIQPILGKLNNLLEIIKNLVQNNKSVYRLVYDHQEKTLKMYEFDSFQTNLPKDLMKKFSI